jgi:hypothetical protein
MDYNSRTRDSKNSQKEIARVENDAHIIREKMIYSKTMIKE